MLVHLFIFSEKSKGLGLFGRKSTGLSEDEDDGEEDDEEEVRQWTANNYPHAFL